MSGSRSMRSASSIVAGRPADCCRRSLPRLLAVAHRPGGRRDLHRSFPTRIRSMPTGRCFDGAFGGRRAIAETLVATTPMILGGLAFAVAARAGMFNIGIEGQLVMGGLCRCAGWRRRSRTAGSVSICRWRCWLARVAGGIWGAIPGVLKAKSGATKSSRRSCSTTSRSGSASIWSTIGRRLAVRSIRSCRRPRRSHPTRDCRSS